MSLKAELKDASLKIELKENSLRGVECMGRVWKSSCKRRVFRSCKFIERIHKIKLKERRRIQNQVETKTKLKYMSLKIKLE